MDELDLNDLLYFARVAEHRGFAAAGRALGLPKSKLSRRIAALEARLGVRLLHRSTRRFAVTEAGELFLRHCQAVVADAQAARESVAQLQAEPRGTIRMSCPVPLLQSQVGPIVSRFLAAHPRVRLEIEAVNRRVDVIEEGFDLALRVRTPPLEDSGLAMRPLGPSAVLLVAAPALLDSHGRPPDARALAALPSLDMRRGGEHSWLLVAPDGTEHTVRHQPRLVLDEMVTLRQAAIDGVGVVQLPQFLLEPHLRRGELELVLPGWTAPAGLIHAVMPSRRGLVPAVRAFLDALAEGFAEPA